MESYDTFSLTVSIGHRSRHHLVSAHCKWMLVFAGRPTLVCPGIGVSLRMSLMSSSLLPKQCPVCLVHLTRMIYAIRIKWRCCCFVGCCFQNLFKTVSLHSSHLTFFLPNVLIESKWCNHTEVMTRLHLGRFPVLFDHSDQFSIFVNCSPSIIEMP